MPNVIDLYAGAGGLSLGATRAGFNVVSAVEIDQHAIASHRTNFPHTNHIQRDIMSLSGAELLNLSGIDINQLDGIIGGPPCQGFSSIGHGDVNDVRNELFIKFFSLVGELHPAFFVAENVPGIMHEKYHQIRQTAFSYVSDYILLPPIRIDASDYGAPTTRTRIFFIGYLNDGRVEPFGVEAIEQMKVDEKDKTCVRQALEGLPTQITPTSRAKGVRKVANIYSMPKSVHKQSAFFYQHVTSLIPDGVGDPEYLQQYLEHRRVNGMLPTLHSDEVKTRYATLAYGQRDHISKSARLDPKSFCPTLRAGTGPEKGSFQAVRPIHYSQARVITPREAARLQGFPDWYKLPETIWHSFRQIGNSVSPIVAERILLAIYQRLIL